MKRQPPEVLHRKINLGQMYNVGTKEVQLVFSRNMDSYKAQSKITLGIAPLGILPRRILKQRQ